jgi:hypothetical protein
MKLTIELECPEWMQKVGKIVFPLLAVAVSGAALAVPPKTFAAGETLTAGDLNENFSNLDSRVAAMETNMSAFSAHQTSPQDVTSGAGTTIVFNEKDFDLGSEYSAATGVFTSASGGLYEVTCDVEWDVTQPAGSYDFQTTIFQNHDWNTGVEVGLRLAPNFPHVAAHGLVKLAPGDTLQCQGFQGTGFTVATEDAALQNNSATRFSAIRISP